MDNVLFTQLIAAGLVVALLFAAVIDIRTFTISNWLNLGIALAAPLFWWADGVAFWPDGAIRAGIAVAVFAAFAAAFAIGVMGGGDVKLAAALALWFAPADTLRFIVFTSIAGGLLTLVVLLAHRKWPNWQRDEDGNPRSKPEVPYGVAIATGAIVILAQRFLNHFA